MILTITSQALGAKNQKIAESGLGQATTWAGAYMPVFGSRNWIDAENRVFRHAEVGLPLPQFRMTGNVRAGIDPTATPLWPPTTSLGPPKGQTETSPGCAVA